MRQLFEKFLLLFLSLVISASLFEGGYRLVYFGSNSSSANDFQTELTRSQGESLAQRQNVTSLRGLIRPSSDPGVVYELKPNLDVIFQGKPVRINKHGFRGPNIEVEKGNDTLRIVGLGDSVMFGWGVEEDQSYLAQLAMKLNGSGELKKRVEVLNLGVPGYNTSMEVATLEHKGKQFSPDLIVLNFIKNDWEVPSFMLRPEDPWSLKRCYLCEFVSSRLGYLNRDSAKLVGVDFTGVTGQEKWQVIDEYRYMLGSGGFSKAVENLVRIAAEIKAPVLLLMGSATDQQRRAIDRLIKRWGIEQVQVKQTVDRFFASQAAPVSKEERSVMLRLSAQDPHPNSLGHRLYAEALYEPALRHLRSR